MKVLIRRLLSYRRAGLVVWLAACAAFAGADDATAWVEVEIGDASLSLEIADTTPRRVKGLGGRSELADGTGMVFVFTPPEKACFWMKGMLIDIDIAFIGERGQIFDLVTMAADQRDTHCPAEKAAWVIETPAGWFARQGVRRGDSLPPAALAELETLD